MTIRKSISLDEKHHADILRWWAQQDNASEVVRQLIREHLLGSVTLSDLAREVRELRMALGSGGVVVVSSQPDEPDDLAEALDSLGM